MMAYEDPIKACKDMAKYTFSTHYKDHIVFIEEGVEYVCGVPLGEGNLDIKTCVEILKKKDLTVLMWSNVILIVRLLKEKKKQVGLKN